MLRARLLGGRRLLSADHPLVVRLIRYALPERIPIWGPALRRICAGLYGPAAAGERAARYTLETAGFTLLTAVGLGIVAVTARDFLLGLCALFSIFAVPVVRLQLIERRWKARKQAVVTALPGFVSTILLLTGAGDAIPNAVSRAIERRLAKRTDNEKVVHPLDSESQVLLGDLRHRVPFAQAMEEWSRRLGVREATSFASAVLLLHKRGGEEFTYAMADLTRTLWEKRKAAARTAGEEAASKLVFPMMIIFLVVMLVVGAPAFLVGMP